LLSFEHLLLNREAGIAAELIASGVTLLGRANYAHTGLYGQAFFNLSIGFERTAKLIYIADYAIQHSGAYPSNDELKTKFSHDVKQLFDHAEKISDRLRTGKKFCDRPNTDIHCAIVQVLSEFAKRTRFYNLDTVMGSVSARSSDPLYAWNERVVALIIKKHLTLKKRERIERSAALIDHLLRDKALVSMTDETGAAMNTVYLASRRTGETDVARKWAPLYVLQLARWLTYLLYDLSHEGAYTYQIDGLLGLSEGMSRLMLKSGNRRCWPECYAAFAV